MVWFAWFHLAPEELARRLNSEKRRGRWCISIPLCMVQETQTHGSNLGESKL